MATTITFAVKGADRYTIGEADIAADPQGYAQEFLAFDDMPGEITIEGDGQILVLYDDLDYLVPELCFRAIPALYEDQPLRIPKASSSAMIDLETSDDTVRIAVTNQQACVFPREELAQGLLACGLRFLAFLQALRGDDSNYTNVIETAREAAQKATAFLAGKLGR